MDIQVNGHGTRISVLMSAPSDHSHGYPNGYPCGCPCRIVRADARVELSVLRTVRPGNLNGISKRFRFLRLYRVIHEPLDTQFRPHRMRRCAVGCLFPVLPPRTSEVQRSSSFSMNFDRAANTWRSIDTFYMLHLT